MIDLRTHKGFIVTAPVKTHFRPAKNCAEINCENYLKGWKTIIDESTELGRSQARYIRKESGRGFREQKTESGLTEFIFEPGQNCFALSSHRVRLDKPHRYFEKGRLGTVEVEYNHWQDDFAIHQEIIKKERG